MKDNTNYLIELDDACGRLSAAMSVFSLIMDAYEKEEAATQRPNSKYYSGILNGFNLCESEMKAAIAEIGDIVHIMRNMDTEQSRAEQSSSAVILSSLSESQHRQESEVCCDE